MALRWFIIFLLAAAANSVFGQSDTVYVYGPGGPFAPFDACAKAFTKKTGIPVVVVAGPEPKWIASAKQNADIIFAGAEYMLTQFIQNHPGMLDVASQTELYSRPAGILVRPGNPKNIHSFKDLAKPGIRLLDINGSGQLGLWEDIAGRLNLISAIRKKIDTSYANTALGIAAWKRDKSYDAWITYASWHYSLTDVTELLPIPPSETVFRGTPLALTRKSTGKKAAIRFIAFMKSDEGHLIFKKYSWN